MSFEKKIYNIEIAPPINVWNNISIELDDLLLESKLKTKLFGLNSIPADSNWDIIEEDLKEFADTKRIAKKLNKINETPPAGIWNRIEEQLNEDFVNSKLAKHLSAIEMNPPEKSWNTIVSELNTTTSVLPFVRKDSRFIKYAAAAVVVGLIAWGGVNFLKRDTNKPVVASMAKGEKAKPIIPSPVQNTEILNSDKTVIASTIDTKAPLKKQVSTKEKKTTIIQTDKDIIASLNSFQNNHAGTEEIIAEVNNAQRNKKAGIVNNESDTVAPRYLMYLSDDCSIVKVSKKLADLQCIYNKDGGVTQNALASLNKQSCDDLVKSWQEKLAKAPLSSFDPLELADILK
jgi:hypothetical protein